MGARLMAAGLVVAVILAGPLPPLATAQQPGPTETPAQLPAPPGVPQAQPPVPEPPGPPVIVQPPPPPPPPVAPPPPPPPVMVQPPPPPPAPVAMQPPPRPVRKRQGADIYDVGAGAITVVTLPLKAAICAISVPLGLTLLAITFGSADRASTAIVREGCGQKWVVRGEDIRPEPPPEQALEWDQQR